MVPADPIPRELAMIAWLAVAHATDARAACASGDDEAACVELLIASTADAAAEALSGSPPVREEEVLALATRLYCPECAARRERPAAPAPVRAPPAPPRAGPREVQVIAAPGARVRAVALGPAVHDHAVPPTHPFPSVVIGPHPVPVGVAVAPRPVGEALADAEGIARFTGLPDRVRVEGLPVPDGPGTWVIRAAPPAPVRIRVQDPAGQPVSGARVWSESDLGVTDRDGWAEIECRQTVFAADARREGRRACGSPVTLERPRQVCRARDQVFPCDELAERLPVAHVALARVDGPHELAELVRLPRLDDDARDGGVHLPGAWVIEGDLWLPRGPLPPEGWPLVPSRGQPELRCLRGAVEPGVVPRIEPCRPVARRVVVDGSGRPVSVTLHAEPDLVVTSALDGVVELAPERAWRWGDTRLADDGERLTLDPFGGSSADDRAGSDLGSRPTRRDLSGDWRSVRDGGAVLTLEPDGGRDPMGYPVRVHAFWPGGAMLLHDPESHRGRRTAYSVLAFATPDRAVLLEPGAPPLPIAR